MEQDGTRFRLALYTKECKKWRSSAQTRAVCCSRGFVNVNVCERAESKTHVRYFVGGLCGTYQQPKNCNSALFGILERQLRMTILEYRRPEISPITINDFYFASHKYEPILCILDVSLVETSACRIEKLLDRNPSPNFCHRFSVPKFLINSPLILVLNRERVVMSQATFMA